MHRLSFLSPVLVVASILIATPAAHARIPAHAVRARIAGIDVVACPTGAKDVVAIYGALPAGDAFAGDGNPAIPTLVGLMLDQGTTGEDKVAIAEKLDRVGASISYEVSTEMAEVEAKCLKQDVPLVLGLIAAEMRSPAFLPEEFEHAKNQFARSLQRQLEDTDVRAAGAFSRAVYPAGHPNRQPPLDDYIQAAGRATLDEARAFHAKYYGPAHFTLVFAGDVDVPRIQADIARYFGGWTGGVDFMHPARATPAGAPRNQNIFMPDKTGVTVVLGQATGLRYRDPDAQALRLGTAVLGGGFASRLTAGVRDREGLAYDIRSSLEHDTLADGDWRITATLSPALLDKGVAAIRRQLENWHEHGVTDAELARCKTAMIGSFKVGLDTTDGMAGTILTAIERGYDIDWLDNYPQIVDAITTSEVNAAIRKYLDPEKMHLVQAGTIPGAK